MELDHVLDHVFVNPFCKLCLLIGQLSLFIFKIVPDKKRLLPLCFLFSMYFISFLKKSLFIFRQRGREGERERNINVREKY